MVPAFCTCAGVLSRIASITLNIVVFAPIPSASEMTAMNVNAGLRRIARRLYRTSCPIDSMVHPGRCSRKCSRAAVVLPNARRAANWASSALIPARIKRSTSIAMCDSISAAKSFDERRVHHFQKPQRMAS